MQIKRLKIIHDT